MPIPRRRLYNYDCHEIALVLSPDIRRRALVLKSAGSGSPDTLSAEQLQKLFEFMDGRRVDKARMPMGADAADNPRANQGNLSQQGQRTLEALARLLAPFRDEITMNDVINVGESVGLAEGGLASDGGEPMESDGNNPDSGLDFTDEGIDAGDGQNSVEEHAALEAVPLHGDEKFGDDVNDDETQGDDASDLEAMTDAADEDAERGREDNRADGQADDDEPEDDLDDDIDEDEADSEGEAANDHMDKESDDSDEQTGNDDVGIEDEVDADDADEETGGALTESLGWDTPKPDNVHDDAHAEAAEAAKQHYLATLKKKGYKVRKKANADPPNKNDAGSDDNAPRAPGKGRPPMADKTQVNKSSPTGVDLSKFTPEQRQGLEPILKSSRQASREIEKLASENRELIEKNGGLEKRLKAIEAANEHKELVEKASAFTHLGDFEGIARTAAALQGDAREAYLKQCEAMNARMEKVEKSSSLFEERGSRTGGEGAMRVGDNDFSKEIDKLAADMVNKSIAAGQKMSPDQAADLVMRSPAGRALYNQYEAQRQAKAPALVG